MTRAARYLPLLILVAALLTPLSSACAATVSGSFVTSGGAPLANRQLHFENHLSGDIYVVHTGSNGSFSVSLPPGEYQLRSKDGAILKSPITVGTSDVNIGKVEPSGTFDFWGLFQRQTMAPANIETPAPSTAKRGTSVGSSGSPSGNAHHPNAPTGASK